MQWDVFVAGHGWVFMKFFGWFEGAGVASGGVCVSCMTQWVKQARKWTEMAVRRPVGASSGRSYSGAVPLDGSHAATEVGSGSGL